MLPLRPEPWAIIRRLLRPSLEAPASGYELLRFQGGFHVLDRCCVSVFLFEKLERNLCPIPALFPSVAGT